MTAARAGWPPSERPPAPVANFLAPVSQPTETSRFTTTLVDGRELHYFDSVPGVDRSARDERASDGPVGPTEVRWDPLFEDYAVIATHRQSRIYQPVRSDCPLCPSRDGRHTEIPAADYEVAVFENRFPAFASQVAEPAVDGQFPRKPASGRCEVVSFTSDHNGCFAELSERQARTVIDAWADRTLALGRQDRIKYVMCFENRGEDVGVTLSHPHGQIYGYPFVPPRFARAAAVAERHTEATGRCLQCDQLDAELADGTRVIRHTEHWVAYVPFAARWPYEVRIAPLRHTADLPSLDRDQRRDLAALYLDVLRRFDGLFDAPAPYIAAWLQAPADRRWPSWHLAAEVFTLRRASSRLKYLAGAESVAATWINDISPEAAARRLVEAGSNPD
ncbi:MAG: galactose-1-phosphate uridylyltransferase [Actinomycetota bacterium]|nr:galactose-1-phosphate uridylyltransferase [Actinomycetota bacterium]MDQ2955915.1 galactose-1-phosphate uridylyltransferase [Actinomycetota bacterium]